MPIIGYGSNILAKLGGKLASSSGCCCDDQATEPPLPPAPEDPSKRCDCSLFSVCTTTVSYDGLVFAYDSSSNAFRQADKIAGNEVYGGGSGSASTFVLAPFRSLSINGCDERTRLFGNPDCGSPAVQDIQHHFRVSYKSVGLTNGGDVATVSAYKYELDLGFDDPCPATLAGRVVTVREVARTRIGGTPTNGNCNPTCEEIFELFKDIAFPATHNATLSFSWQPFDWANRTGVVCDARTNQFGCPPSRFSQKQEASDTWLCNHPIWQNTNRPTVTVACAP